jgi:rubrerythrin
LCGLYEPIFHFASPDDYKRRLIEVRDRQSAMVRDDQAVSCGAPWMGDHRREGEQLQRQVAKLLVRAFNAECDAVTAKVTWNNVARMIERIKHAFDAINKLGRAMHLELAAPYRELKLDELRLEYEVEQKRRDQLEEQRAIREQQREEDHVQRGLERVCAEAEDEEAAWQRALDPAYRELAMAHGAAVPALRANIATIESELREARQRKERAILRAEKGRAGHVYILSNIGSFGRTVYKIGMTRRDNPLEHVHELDASVPFNFDVHAMIPSEDAPALESRLHRAFHDRRVNAVDLQREFFHVTLDEIEAFARSQGIAVQLTKLAEARQYKETLELRRMASERANPWQVHDRSGYAYPAAL